MSYPKELEEHYYIPSDWLQPDWSSYERVHNWRNHVPLTVQEIWHTFTDEQKKCLSKAYKNLADNEDWE